jgi:hypothetical protein
MSFTLASVYSLRGPHARSTRAKTIKEIDTAPLITGPEQMRYPHSAKQWQLGVGRPTFLEDGEGLFAIGTSAEGLVFREDSFISLIKGHQQATKPKQLNNRGWSHNGIPEGHEKCVCLNAYNNTDSPIRWLQIAAAEPLANCRLRRVPRSQGGGLGLYAAEDIWYEQHQ